MEGCTDFPVEKDTLQNLIVHAKDYLVTHGIVMPAKNDPTNGDLVTHKPVTLFPSPVPRTLFLQAQAVQKDINLLMHHIAHDHCFLKHALQSVIKVDEFTRNLWDLYDTVTKEGIAQPYSLGINRADYLFDYNSPTDELLQSGERADLQKATLQQVEINTISASGGAFRPYVEDYHRFMLERLNKHYLTSQIPDSDSLQVLVKGITKAWEVYGNPSSVILFLVYPVELNIYDQRLFEYAIYKENSQIKVIRRSLKDIQERGKLTTDRSLVIDGMEIALVYQRCLYTPDDFKDNKDWSARLMLERSRAIKCPSVGYHLAGTKKVQQVMSQPGMVERFIQDPEAVTRIRETFTAQYSLDLDADGDRALAMAMENPELFVMKPQREGGGICAAGVFHSGNNIYGEDIRTLLSAIKDTEDQTSYILMRYIHPIPVHNYMMRSGNETILCNCVSELGVFGAVVGSKDTVILNVYGGQHLRTKAHGTHEGGINAGCAVYDSPMLVD